MRHAYALLVVMAGWVLFRCETFHQAVAYFAALAGMAPSSDTFYVEWCLTTDLRLAILFGAILSGPVLPVLSRWHAWKSGTARAAAELSLQAVRLAGLTLLLVTCCMSLAAGTHNPFIYFRF